MLRELASKSLVYGATDTVKTMTIYQKGDITDFLITIPDFTTAATLVLTVKDKDSRTWYTSSALSKNQTNLRVTPTAKIPIFGEAVVTATLNAVAGGTGGTVVLACAIEARK